MAQQSKKVVGGLARHLMSNGSISEEDALKATEDAAKNKAPLVTQIIQNKLISAYDLASAAANEFGQPFFDLDSFEFDPEFAPAINEKLIRTHHAIGLYKRANRLFVAISDPLNFNALDEFKFHAGANAEAILVEDDKLTSLIEKVLDDQDTSMDDLGDDDGLEDLDISAGEEEDKGAVSESEVNDAPVVKFVNKILLDAIKKGASDLHFEPYEKRYRIRFRTDGMLKEVASPPIQLAGKLAARIKVMSQLDISERRVPQDGRIKLKISKNKSIDFRVSTCPTLFGEKTVMRILDSSSASLGIDMLGYEPVQKQLYMDNLAKPTGMILVTGPTGSGKTVSLYTGLNILNTEEVNISTAEDPVEINLEGINQVNVNPKVGLTFESALKAFLRQDPDIIMVGEIRDITTAEIAVKAAQTGHMVMSTLHTNDAPQTLARLVNIG
ncbi:MAG: ATPase, T2SS/T4P/T4SS family, partial [Chromatiales bacterium]|nr:ATPase, T2SS/T4P/T4SS family [Chromatiales bacterium]